MIRLHGCGHRGLPYDVIKIAPVDGINLVLESKLGQDCTLPAQPICVQDRVVMGPRYCGSRRGQL